MAARWGERRSDRSTILQRYPCALILMLRYCRSMRVNLSSFTGPIESSKWVPLVVPDQCSWRNRFQIGAVRSSLQACRLESRVWFRTAWKSLRRVNKEHWSGTTSGTQRCLFNAGVVVRRAHFDGLGPHRSCPATRGTQSFDVFRLETAQHQNALTSRASRLPTVFRSDRSTNLQRYPCALTSRASRLPTVFELLRINLRKSLLQNGLRRRVFRPLSSPLLGR